MAQATSVAVNAAGEIFLTGSFAGSIDFGSDTLTDSGMGSLFVAKLDPNGVPMWSEGSGDGQGQGTSLTVDVNGDVIVIGSFTGTIDLGGITTGIDGGASGALLMAKLDTDGNAIWSESFWGVEGTGVAVDPSGNVLLVGNLDSSVNLAGCPLETMSGGNGFVAKLDSDGACLWSVVLGDTGPTSFGGASPESVAVDALGNAIVTGTFNGTVNFGDVTLNGLFGGVFVLKLDSMSGAYAWVNGFPGATAMGAMESGAFGAGVALDAMGNVFVTGAFFESVDFGGLTPLVSAGGSDILLASFDTNGNYRWAESFGNPQLQTGVGIAVDSSCHVVIVGQYQGTFDFGGNPIADAGAGVDTYVAKFEH